MIKLFFCAAVVTAAVSTTACAAQLVTPAAETTGFYLSTDNLDSAAKLPSDAALKVPGVDGVFVRIPWVVINPAREKYDFALFDILVKQSVAAGKKLSIGVLAGDSAPGWLSQNGVQFARVQVVKKGCVESNVPAVWSDAYVTAYVGMMTELKNHLVKIGAYDSVKIVKLSGITKRTLELSLPNDNRCSSTVDEQLAQMGYRPGRLLGAWGKIAQAVAALYPKSLIVQPILQVQGFPAIDDSGQRIGRPQVNVGNRIIDLCIKDFGKRCGVQWNGLNLNGKLASRVTDARDHGASIGWQTNLFEGPRVGAGCQTDRNALTTSCTAATYAQLLKRGVDTGATFIEVWEPDMLRYPYAYRVAGPDWGS